MHLRQSTVGVMTKNTGLQLWCMYLSGGAYLLMRTESDYFTL